MRLIFPVLLICGFAVVFTQAFPEPDEPTKSIVANETAPDTKSVSTTNAPITNAGPNSSSPPPTGVPVVEKPDTKSGNGTADEGKKVELSTTESPALKMSTTDAAATLNYTTTEGMDKAELAAVMKEAAKMEKSANKHSAKAGHGHVGKSKKPKGKGKGKGKGHKNRYRKKARKNKRKPETTTESTDKVGAEKQKVEDVKADITNTKVDGVSDKAQAIPAV